MIIKPMLAATYRGDYVDIPYPVLATPKLDGIRCLRISDEALSRNFKPIPNKHIFNLISELTPEGFDGEIITLSVGKIDEFNTVQSKVMTIQGKPDFKYIVFDYVKETCSRDYSSRISDLSEVTGLPDFVEKLIPDIINSADEMEEYVAKQLSQGFEGICFRSMNSPYKAGRSTLKQWWLVKVKQFFDSEAEVIGIEELMRNTNAAEIGELGQTKRSKHNAGMEPGGTAGKVIVRDLVTGAEFAIGSGFDNEMRDAIWNNKEAFLGKVLTYKYMRHGMKDLPRHPIFLHWRLPE